MPITDPLSRADAAHFLRRIGFGGSTLEIDGLVGQTRQQVVAAALDWTGAPALNPPDLSDREAQWQNYVDSYEWWVQRMVSTNKPLQEKMVLFWHGHFCSEQWKVNDMAAMFDQLNLFRTMALGDFHDLCQAVAINPAMLVYLDNASNRVGNEQENFARELMELFTIGIGNYTEADVVSMAKAWTGYSTVGWNGSYYDPTFLYRDTWHDTSQKTLFGITRNWTGPETITELVQGSKKQATARFLARKMWKFFAHTTPSDALVNSLATTFMNATPTMSIRALVEAVLHHDDFWGPASRYQLVKSPTEFVVSLLRRVPIPVGEAGLTWSMEPMGQLLWNPPNVAGWGQNDYWLSTATAWGRGGWLASMRWKLDALNFWDELSPDLPSDPRLTPAQGVQKIFDDLGIVDPSNATRSRLVTWFTQSQQSYEWAIQPNALILGGLCAEFQLA